MIYLSISIVVLAILFVVWLILRGRHKLTIVEIPEYEDPSERIEKIHKELEDEKEDIKNMDTDSLTDRANAVLRRRRRKNNID